MSKENLKQVLGILLFMTVWAWFSHSASSDVLPDFVLTEEGVKGLDPGISQVSIIGGSFVSIDIIKDPFTGGAQDWNSLASSTFQLAKVLFAKPEVQQLTLAWWTSDKPALDWARVIIDRDKLPPKWTELTYLQFFGGQKLLPGTVETGRWLCDFFERFESARPNGVKPKFCNN